jgi:hypothetical protein
MIPFIVEDENMGALHAHLCQKCAKEGVNLVWLHGAEKGNQAEHTCPRCGTIEWKQFLMKQGDLPVARRTEQNGQAVQEFVSYQDVMRILLYVMLAVGAVILVNEILKLYISAHKKDKTP